MGEALCPKRIKNSTRSGCCWIPTRDCSMIGTMYNIFLLGEFTVDVLFFLHIRDPYDLIALFSFASLGVSFSALVTSWFVDIRECFVFASPIRRHVLRMRWGLIVMNPFLTYIHLLCAFYCIFIRHMTDQIAYIVIVLSALNF